MNHTAVVEKQATATGEKGIARRDTETASRQTSAKAWRNSLKADRRKTSFPKFGFGVNSHATGVRIPVEFNLRSLVIVSLVHPDHKLLADHRAHENRLVLIFAAPNEIASDLLGPSFPNAPSKDQVSAAHPLLLYLFLQGTAASHQKLATLSVNPGEETNPTPLKRSSWQPRMTASFTVLGSRGTLRRAVLSDKRLMGDANTANSSKTGTLGSSDPLQARDPFLRAQSGADHMTGRVT
ncbi:hypothetical protein U0070_007896 [Myodes glareolus]|uniref:Uncharacterized protein n=1 Tax=Myodes glareolus TaxID=447135 RepID=A0AAW0IQ74_MYOGA